MKFADIVAFKANDSYCYFLSRKRQVAMGPEAKPLENSLNHDFPCLGERSC